MQSGAPEEQVEVSLGPEHAGLRLDRALAIALPQHSRERLKALISSGHVIGVSGALRDPARKVSGSERLVVTVPRPAPSENRPQAIPLAIVHEDAHLLVVDKPAGLVVHPAAGNPDNTLVNALLHHCEGRLSGIGGVARPGIVHRIDKDTSGLLVVAKTDPAHVGLARQFAAHSVQREYLAIVEGRPRPQQGRIETHLARSAANRKKVAVVEPPAGKRAVTHWQVTSLLQDAAAVACRLETGRTHQVRVHMAAIGHSLVGDSVYGSRNARRIGASAGFQRQALHARTLGFRHPVTQEELSFESPVPRDIQELVSLLSV
ncbi:MAG: RluA family pseudouridine synthase [Thermaurantiacus sp.]